MQQEKPRPSGCSLCDVLLAPWPCWSILCPGCAAFRYQPQQCHLLAVAQTCAIKGGTATLASWMLWPMAPRRAKVDCSAGRRRVIKMCTRLTCVENPTDCGACWKLKTGLCLRTHRLTGQSCGSHSGGRRALLCGQPASPACKSNFTRAQWVTNGIGLTPTRVVQPVEGGPSKAKSN